jgi:hypothetical protein
MMHIRRSTSFVDQGVEIFDLARNSIRRCVAAIAAPATVVGEVVGEHGAVRRQQRGQVVNIECVRTPNVPPTRMTARPAPG